LRARIHFREKIQFHTSGREKRWNIYTSPALGRQRANKDEALDAAAVSVEVRSAFIE
jgi:hypothetical protein